MPIRFQGQEAGSDERDKGDVAKPLLDAAQAPDLIRPQTQPRHLEVLSPHTVDDVIELMHDVRST